jgi:hypothetical protein
MPASARAFRRRLALCVGIAIVAGAGAYVSFTAARLLILYRDVVEAKGQLLDAEAALRRDGLDTSGETIAAARADMTSACADFRSARRFLDREPLLAAAGALPGLGPQVRAASGLSDIGCEAAAIGLAGLDAIETVSAARDSDGRPSGESAVAVLAAVQPEIDAAETSLDAIRDRRTEIGDAWLMPPLPGLVRGLDARLAEIDAALARYGDARTVASDVLGAEEPRTYLLLALDNTELTPGGGLIGVYGVVTIDAGRVIQRHFDTPADLTARWQAASGGQYVEPPAPLKRYLLRGYTWSLGVANWSPHFPQAARQAMAFHELAGEEPVDGVIAVDYTALEGLLDVLGPTEVEAYGATVDADTVVDEVLARLTVNQRPGDRPNAFGVALAAAVVDDALAADEDDWSPLAETLQRLAGERHLFLYSRRPDVERSLIDLGWAGVLEQPPGDYLMSVNASVHSTKLNLLLEEETRVDVRLRDDGSAHTTVTIRLENPLGDWARGRDAALVSQAMLSGLYGAYLRLLVPPQARLLDVRVDGVSVGAEEVTTETGKASFGRYVAVPRDAEATLAFEYEVPHATIDGEYRLYVQKQPGAAPHPLRVDLRLPPGESADYIALDGQTLDDRPLHIDTDFSRDREFTVRY